MTTGIIMSIIEAALGGSVVITALTFAILYDRVDWFSSYVGRTTMVSTVGTGTFIGLTIMSVGVGLSNLTHPLLLTLGVLALVVLVRKILALRWAQKNIRLKEASEQNVVEHELELEPSEKGEDT